MTSSATPAPADRPDDRMALPEVSRANWQGLMNELMAASDRLYRDGDEPGSRRAHGLYELIAYGTSKVDEAVKADDQ